MMKFVLQNGWSPLYVASENGHLEVVKTLIEARADVNQANKVHCNIFTHQRKYVCDSIACIHGVHVKISAYVYHVHSCMCSVYFMHVCFFYIHQLASPFNGLPSPVLSHQYFKLAVLPLTHLLS